MKYRNGQQHLRSVQEEFVQVCDIQGDILCLRAHPHAPHSSYRAIIEVATTNYQLRSEEEQEAIIAGYRNFLKALSFDIQMVMRSQPLDLLPYLAKLDALLANETLGGMWHRLTKAHRTFLLSLASQRILLEHRFYLVLSADDSFLTGQKHWMLSRKKRRHLQADRLEGARQQLQVRCEMVMQHLNGIGLYARRLAREELTTLSYSCLTPERARTYRLTPEKLAGVGRPKYVPAPPRQEAAHRQLVKKGMDSPQEEEGVSESAAVPTTQQTSLPEPGFLQLPDVLAPASVEETPTYLCLEGEYVRGLAITDFPREVTAGWLAPLLLHDEPVDIVFHLHPQNSNRVVRQLLRRKAEFRSMRRVNAQRGSLDDPHAQVAEADIDGLIGKVASGEERVFETGFYVLARASDLETLNGRTERLMALFDNLLLVARPTTFQHACAFRSFLPEGRDELRRTCMLDSQSLATAFPFMSNSLSMANGVLEGVTSTGEPVIIDDWGEELDNPHRFVGAITGAGKSYYAKLKIMRELVVRHEEGMQIAVIDPEQEYLTLCASLGGDYLRLAPGSRQHVNPFDLLPPGMDIEAYCADRSRGDRLAEKVQGLHALFDMMLADRGPQGTTVLSSREKGLLDRAIYETYRKLGISADPRTHDRPVPLLRDLYDVLISGVCGKDEYGLADRMYRFVSGSLSGIFSAPTDIQLDNRLVVFDIRDMSGELRPIATWLITDFVWTQVLSSQKPRALYIDEAWSLIQHPEGGRFLADLARRARKRYLKLVTITQNPELFVEDAWGSVVAANASIKVLKKQDRTSAQAVSQRFQLTLGEQQRLLTFQKKEALVLAGSKRVILSIDASPLEHELATTNPREVYERAQAHPERDIREGEVVLPETGDATQPVKGQGPDEGPDAFFREAEEGPATASALPKGGTR